MNKTRFTSLTASMVLAMAFTFSCDSNFKDSRDGKTYKKVTIGSQTWMAENLNFAAEGSTCYETKPENCEKYGRLYNWETAMKTCPSGWHLPNNDEYNALFNTVGGVTEGNKLKAKSGFDDYDGKSGNGTDDFGFSALPGGGGYDGSFGGAGREGGWWSASEEGSEGTIYRSMSYGYDVVGADINNQSIDPRLYSVRCIKD